MDARGTTDSGTAHAARLPSEVYEQRLQELNRLQASERRRERTLGYAKLFVVVITLIAGVTFLHIPQALEVLVLPVGGLIFLAVWQEKLIRRIRFRARAVDFYVRGLARIEDRWAGTGESGERFLDPLHPYARDLDVFGPASLFELLCTARTRAGEETLAAWLLAAAPVDEILQRQEAVRDLRPRLQFREELYVLGETIRFGVHPDELVAWGERAPIFNELATRIATRALAALWLLGLVLWAIWGFGYVALAISLLNLAWAHRIHRRLDEACGTLEKAADDLAILSRILARFESEGLNAARLAVLQAALHCGDIPSSDAIKKLARLVEYIQSRHSLFLRPLDLFTFWSAHLVFAAERWQQQFGPAIRHWLNALGELEALTALAGYSYEHPADVFPEFEAVGPVLDAELLAHPLLPSSTAVCNDVTLGPGLRLLILSGPNMAGKSTFIRSIGVNAVLAQCGAPVRAARLRISPLQVAASICILDSLSGGVSRFYAEIHRIKAIFDLSSRPIPVLFLLDELLSGTNSHDRLAGSEFIVRSLIQRGAIGIASTHDLALTSIPDELDGRAANCHFEDRFEEGKLIFDYKIKPGVVKTSNALELMRSIGLGVFNSSGE
jgi:hypothetical protein